MRKVTKLPRKLKKSLKTNYLAAIDPTWTSKDLKIYGYTKNYRGQGYSKITSWTLGL